MDREAHKLPTGEWLCEGPMRRIIVTEGVSKSPGRDPRSCRQRRPGSAADPEPNFRLYRIRPVRP